MRSQNLAYECILWRSWLDIDRTTLRTDISQQIDITNKLMATDSILDTQNTHMLYIYIYIYIYHACR